MIQNNDRKKKEKRTGKFSLRTLFVATTIAAMFFGWIFYLRGRSANRLNQLFESLGPAHVTVTDSVDGNRGWWYRLIKDTDSRPKTIRFYGLTNESAGKICDNAATDRIEDLTLVHYAKGTGSFFNGDSPLGMNGEFDPPLFKIHNNDGNDPFEADCPMFFHDWPSLKRLTLRDCKVPPSWMSRFKTLSGLEEITISGGLCNADPELFAGLENLNRIVLCHRGITSQRLNSLRAQFPGVSIELLGSFETPFPPTADDSCLSHHDEAAYQRMKELLDRLDKAILENGGNNTVPGPPATEAEIAALEHRLGVPLPPCLRAFYEVSNGWKNAPTFIWDGIRNTSNVAGDYQVRTSYVYRPDEYDFTPFGFDQFANPNAIPVNSCHGILFDRGELCNLDEGGESGPYAYNKPMNLFAAFEHVLKEINEGKFDIYRGKLEQLQGRLTVEGNFRY